MTDRLRTQTIKENGEEDMHLSVARPPEFVIKGRVACGVCSTSHEPQNKRDTHPQCPWCGNLIDLTAHMKTPNPRVEHGPNLTPAA